MKLKNKKTGEIADLEHRGLLKSDNNNHIIVYPEGTLKYYAYNSLAELNAEWEDYEEPKEDGLDHIITLVEAYSNHDSERYPKEIVEKLKAWKRLKDKGFRFGHWVTVREKKCGKVEFKCDDIRLTFDEARKFYNDISLLFGGKEC